MLSVSATERRVFAIVLLLAGLLPIPAIFLLVQVGWPDSLQGMPFAEALPLVQANPTAFRFGYSGMMLSGVLFIPAAVYLVRALASHGETGVLGWVLAAFALAGGTLRSLWYAAVLTGIPVLGRLWESGDEATRAAVNVFYIAINDTLSTIQEDIGVNLFVGTFLLLAAVAIWRSRAYPRWTAVMGMLAGLAFISSSSEFIGIPNGAIIPFLGPVLSSLWLAALGGIDLARPATSATHTLRTGTA